MVGCRRQFGLVYINIIYITLSCKHTLYIGVAYTSYLTGSLNIFIGKILVPNFSILFAHLSASGKPYYNSSLSLNKSIDLTNISS